ncbi:MAG: rhodanese-like domain-containing protein, partial [Gammaproteobacteria bacterium]
RSGTEMKAFGDTLSEAEIDGIVTFLRSRAQGWDVEEMKFEEPPELDNIVLNPEGDAPDFELTDGRYVSASDLNEALQAGNRMIIIDTRVPYFWAMAHIEGSMPVPYYSSREEFISALPKDDTWIVAYCECPRAAADSAVSTLRQLGYENTAVLYEGYAGWSALGYPVRAGKVDPARVNTQHDGHSH